jgi:hypothetical protein
VIDSREDQLLPARCRGFLRMWRIVVLLRCHPHTLHDLAVKLGVCTRTIRRDLKALQAVPLPIGGRFPEGESRKGIQAQEPQLWSWGETPAWPRREVAPIANIGSAGALPPFPKGPLLPPGARL